MEQSSNHNAARHSTTTLSLPSTAPAGPEARAVRLPYHRHGKEPLVDERTEEEKTPVLVNFATARGLAPARLLAVGVLLSVIAIPSRQLLNYMKNVWRIRGPLESSELADKSFVLNFSEEGDFEHVTKGGPWRYQKDAVLIRELKVGEDPNTVRFEQMPIWAQFTGIPYYLLSKQLARDMGKKLGEFISIDNKARGDIDNKILRARVWLPVAQPLQRWITLKDEISTNKQQVIVDVLYERLPTYCLFCGVIGHKEATCDLPEELKKIRYTNTLGVQATHPDDPRKWYLPESAAENDRALRMHLPWRNVAALAPKPVASPTKHLSVKDDTRNTAGITSNVDTDPEPSITQAPSTGAIASAGGTPPITETDNNNANGSADGTKDPALTPVQGAIANQNDHNDHKNGSRQKNMIDNANVTIDPNLMSSTRTTPTLKSWKRMPREEDRTGPGTDRGRKAKAPRKKDNNTEDNGPVLQTGPERSALGKRQGRAAEAQNTKEGQDDSNKPEEKNPRGGHMTRKVKEGGGTKNLEATSHGAAGQLAGASVSACQEQ